MERNAAKPLIHVGYHKTGTTWLQTGLFEDAEAGFTRPWHSSVIRDALVFPDGFEFDPAAARAVFAPEIERAAEGSLVAVVSDERLSGSPHAGGHDSATIADRLVEVFPEGRVLIVIREQRSAIYSIYQQYVRDGGAARLDRYLNPRNPAEVPQFRFEHWRYHPLIARYLERFGGDRVCVLPYEWLREDPECFLRRLAEFAGLMNVPRAPSGRRYRSLGALTLALKRRANFWTVRNSLNPAAPLYVKNHEARFERLDRWLPRAWSRPLERRLRARVERAVAGRYTSSNARTTELIGIDLGGLGYDLGGGGASG